MQTNVESDAGARTDQLGHPEDEEIAPSAGSVDHDPPNTEFTDAIEDAQVPIHLLLLSAIRHYETQLVASVKTLQANLITKRSQLDDITGSQARDVSELTAAKTQIAKIKTDRHHVEEICQRTSRQLATARAALDEVQSELVEVADAKMASLENGLDREIERLRTELALLKGEKEARIERHESLLSQRHQLEKEIERASEELELSLKGPVAISAETTELHSEIDALRGKQASENQALGSLESEAERLITRRRHAEERISALQQELKNQRGSRKSLEHKLNRLQNDEDSALETAHELQLEQSRLQVISQGLKDTISETVVRSNRIATDIMAVTRETQRVDITAKQALEELPKVQNEVEALQVEQTHWRRQLIALKAQSTKFDDEVCLLKSKLINAETQKSSDKAEYEEVRKALKTKLEEIEVTRKEIRQLELQARSFQNDTELHTQEILKLGELNKVLDDELLSLTTSERSMNQRFLETSETLKQLNSAYHQGLNARNVKAVLASIEKQKVVEFKAKNEVLSSESTLLSTKAEALGRDVAKAEMTREALLSELEKDLSAKNRLSMRVKEKTRTKTYVTAEARSLKESLKKIRTELHRKEAERAEYTAKKNSLQEAVKGLQANKATVAEQSLPLESRLHAAKRLLLSREDVLHRSAVAKLDVARREKNAQAQQEELQVKKYQLRYWESQSNELSRAIRDQAEAVISENYRMLPARYSPIIGSVHALEERLLIQGDRIAEKNIVLEDLREILKRTRVPANEASFFACSLRKVIKTLEALDKSIAAKSTELQVQADILQDVEDDNEEKESLIQASKEALKRGQVFTPFQKIEKRKAPWILRKRVAHRVEM